MKEILIGTIGIMVMAIGFIANNFCAIAVGILIAILALTTEPEEE